MTSNSNGSWMDKILDALRSPGAMMIALMLALLAQGEHTAQVFAFFSHSNGGNSQALAYAFAAAVEVAVLLFVLRGHKHISYAFAVATLCTNIVYYAIGGIDLLSVAVAPVLLLSALLPGVIVGYSHTIAETPNSNATQPATAQDATAPGTRRRWQFWRKPTEAAATSSSATNAPQTPVALPVGTLTAQNVTEAASQPAAELPKQDKAADKPAPALRKVSNVTVNATDTELAAQLGVTRQAVAGMRRRGTLAARVARDLPELAPVHVNGNGYHA